MLRNPVGTLQELCMAEHWTLPYYQLVEEEGDKSKQIFTVVCKLYHNEEKGKLDVCVALGTLSNVHRRVSVEHIISELRDFESGFSLGDDLYRKETFALLDHAHALLQ